MIVTVFESEDQREAQPKLLQTSDLALVKTDKRSWDNETIYRVTKSRFPPKSGSLIKASEINEFVEQYEENLLDVKRNENVEVDF